MIVAGLGFRRGVTAEEIEAVIALALDRIEEARNMTDSPLSHREPLRRTINVRLRESGPEATCCPGDRAMDRARQIDLDALATLAEKAREPGLQEAARRLSLPVIPCSREAMMAVQDRIATVSARVEAAVGLPSVAEAAALVAAGVSSRLVLPRIATAATTCAIAEGDAP